MKGDIRVGGEKAQPKRTASWSWSKSPTRSGGLVDVARDQRKRDRSHRNRKWEAAALVVVLLLGGMIYVARQSFAHYRDIAVSGNKGVSQEVIRERVQTYMDSRVLGIIPRASVFAFRDNALAREVSAQDIRIRDVAVATSIFSHRVEIIITEYEPWARWCGSVGDQEVREAVVSVPPCPEGASGEQCAVVQPQDGRACGFIGDDGMLFALTKEEGNIPLVTDNRSATHVLGEHVLDDAWLRIIREWTREGALPQEYVIRAFTLEASGSMRAHTQEGWDIVGDATLDPVSALAYLRTALEQEIKEKRAQLEYVDVRFGKKVFYKLRV